MGLHRLKGPTANEKGPVNKEKHGRGDLVLTIGIGEMQRSLSEIMHKSIVPFRASANMLTGWAIAHAVAAIAHPVTGIFWILPSKGK